jgi:helicase
MQGLLILTPALLNSVRLVIVDELQMIGDPKRGAGLEILLTKIKLAAKGTQIIGLSAVLGNSNRLARWLDAGVCQDPQRPVPLRKGILCKGVFKFQEHNSTIQGEEKFEAPEEDLDEKALMIDQARKFAQKKEQCLVFCPAKKDCITMAKGIVSGLHLMPAKGAIKELANLEESNAKDTLRILLEKGVAYHNADLTWELRDIVERGFKKGEIRVICATTTLAMGLNLPAKNVLVPTEKWEQDHFLHWGLVPITQGEYENISGRAGRLGIGDEFGRAIIITGSKFRAGVLFNKYVKGTLGEVVPPLERNSLGHHILNLVASGICRTIEEIKEILLSSFSGESPWKGPDQIAAFEKELQRNLDQCIKGELLGQVEDHLFVTPLGRMAAVKGISVETAIRMGRFAKRMQNRLGEVSLLGTLLFLAVTEDGERIHFNLSTGEVKSNRYLKMLHEAIGHLPELPQRPLKRLLELKVLTYERAKRAKKALILYNWLSGAPTRRIEEQFNTLLGSIGTLASEFSWLADAFTEAAFLAGWPQTWVSRLELLSRRMVFGVASNAVEIAQTRTFGLGRSRMAALLNAGLDTMEKIRSCCVSRKMRLRFKAVRPERGDSPHSHFRFFTLVGG